MAEEEPLEPSTEGDSEMVTVIVARSEDEAEEYVELLSDHDIPAVVGTDGELDEDAPKPRRGLTRGVPVLVPEVLLDEASEVIADRESVEGLPVGDEDEDEEDEDEDEDELPFTGELRPDAEEEILDEEEDDEEDVFAVDDEDDDLDAFDDEDGLDDELDDLDEDER